MALRSSELEKGLAELRDARQASKGLLGSTFLFSVFVNLLMLTGPLFMLQVYDRVLGSRSEETLAALFALVAFLYLMMGLLDYARGRVMARVSARFQTLLDARVFTAVVKKASTARGQMDPQSGVRDLDAVQRFLGSPALLSAMDAPWTPVFLAAIFIFHPMLGALALCGGALIVVVAIFNQLRTRAPMIHANQTAAYADHLADQMRTEAEMVRSLGMEGAAFARWQKARSAAADSRITVGDRAGRYQTLSKSFRLFLQSAMLAVGAYYVLQGELTPGAMIAGSILMGRALAPIDQTIGQWELIQRARTGWTSLGELLAEVPPEPERMPLPDPAARLDVQSLTVVPPGEQQAALRMVSFTVEPGQALGVIGPSGAGKSTLARALTGFWKPAGGRVRLDGAALDQYDPDVLGGHIGYLPQRVALFDGTIAENIARMTLEPDPEKVVAAARKAAADEMIRALPQGYDTRVSAAAGRLSGGQMQRIGLARAMYGDPAILVLDEPNSNLDNEGTLALNKAIRERKENGKSVLIMAHRPAAIQECDLLLVLENGARKAFGPRDQVLHETVANAAQIQNSTDPGGVR